jgi:amino acid adenylation domain-containing protein
LNLRGVEDLYELSPMQQGILFHSLAASEPGVYLIKMGWTLQGKLDVEVLAAAWQRVVDRNPILRMSFHWEKIRKPLQVVHREVRLGLERHDWAALSDAEREERRSAYLETERRRGFELGRAPLMRVAVIRMAEDRHELFWTFHHILFEGWSASLLLDEVFAFYRALSRGREIELKPRRPYRDYILWLQGQDASKAEAYWRGALRGFSKPTVLEVGRPSGNSRAEEERYESQQLRLSVSTTNALQSLAKGNQLTLSTLMQGAWAILLSRYSGEEDVLFGNVVSGRQMDLAGAESMVGLFVNTLPVRVQVRPGDRLVEWLRRLQDQQGEMRKYEYSSLVQVQGWSEVPRGTRLFESLFVFENWSAGVSLRADEGDLQVVDACFIEGATDFPIAVEAGPGPPLSARFTWDRRRFAGAAVTRLAGHYESLLKGMARHPDARLSELPLLTEAEQHRLVVERNRTAADYARDSCVHELFERRAEERPDAVAVEFDDERVTYRQLDRRANQLAHHLRSLGVGRDFLVGLCVERSLDMVVGVLAVLKAGGAYVPLDPSYPKERLAFMVRDSGVKVLLSQERLAESLPAHGATVVLLDADWARIGEQSTHRCESGVGADNLAYVIYTSGSTGTPKGVLVEHRGLCNVAEAQARAFGVAPSGRVLQFSSLSFDASAFEMVMALPVGATLCLGTRDSLLPGAPLLKFLRDRAISIVTLPPSALAMLPDDELPALETITVAGEACSADLVRRWEGKRRFFNLYGPTETTIWATFATCVDDGATPSIGGPIPNARAYVLSSRLQPVPVGVPGELHIGGVGVARGYLGRPELTAERFVPDPFSGEAGGRLYRTGDLVRYREDEQIEFLGRIDNQVKIRGFRIELGEIESVLGQHAAVKDVVATLREDRPGDTRLVAYVSARDGQGVDAGELRSYLKGKLPEPMVPSAFVFLESLPLSPNGKVDCRALPAPDGGAPREAIYVAPTTELEKLVAEIWKEVLGVPGVGIHDNFFDLGGHSLLIMRVHSRLHESLPGCELPVVALFEHPTVASLAARLRVMTEGGTGQAGVGRQVETREQSDERLREARQRLGRRRELARELDREEGADA